MPHSKLEEIPYARERWSAVGENPYRITHWGDMEVGLAIVPQPLDCTEVCRIGGLPGGLCPCPHYGYIFEGRMRAKYPGTDWPDEVVEAGEAFFIPAGHILIYEEASRVLELNPAHALQVCMDGMQRGLTKMMEAADKASK